MRAIGWQVALAALVAFGPTQAQETRPMTFMDVMELRALGGGTVSPDGKRVAYTIGIPHWKSGKSYTDLFVASA
ncbi:MAG: hypothetical protein NTW40_04420, partial [Acidobacteria bacterium]|nr:hypothetical protein [Acidobacteriota bacterium]